MNGRIKLPADFLTQPVEVIVVGCGGNGSHMLTALAKIHLSWKALGHPHGLRVKAMDPDIITDANAARQCFSPSDIGQHKATVLINRLNLYYGLDWEAIPHKLTAHNADIFGTHIMIGCVDDGPSRAFISKCKPSFYLDMGNEASHGQIIMGTRSKQNVYFGSEVKQVQLPDVTELLPGILEPDKDNTPSCSLMAALRKQDLFINQQMATWAASMLFTWFKTGFLDHHGYFINIDQPMVRKMPICPASWMRMGYFGDIDPPSMSITRIHKRRTKQGKSFHYVSLQCGHKVWTASVERAKCEACKRIQYVNSVNGSGVKIVDNDVAKQFISAIENKSAKEMS